MNDNEAAWVNAVVTIRIPLGISTAATNHDKQDVAADVAAEIAALLPEHLKWSMSGNWENVDHNGNPTQP